MKGKHIRNQFIHFFEHAKNLKHTVMESASLVPPNDRSVLFSIAGMQQFKPYFLTGKKLAEQDFGTARLTSVQKCFRVTDIDEIGDKTHLTFFEMLGNFSVGDYFKEDALRLALTFVTKELHLRTDLMWVTYFGGDKTLKLEADRETKKLWENLGVPNDRIIPRGAKDNFWGPPGETGPCGPSTELYYPINQKKPPEKFDEQELIEIWNIVLMQLEKNKKGEFKELPEKNIDTGMGLERVSMVVEKADSVFDTSLFLPIMKTIATDTAFRPDASKSSSRLRIVADHLRATIFLLADDVAFGKKEQQAVLRRIFRKALDQYEERHADLERVLKTVVEEYGSAYPNLKKKKSEILLAMKEEQEMYLQVRERKVEDFLSKIQHQQFVASQTEPFKGPSERTLTTEETFQLFSTYGFSLEQIHKEGYTFDEKGVKKLVEEHKEKSKQGSGKKFGGHGLDSVHSADIPEEERKAITRLHTATHLLHAALRSILGDQVTQQGSDINSERLRFDFSFPRKLTDEEKKQVEEEVNSAIQRDLAVVKETMSYEEAIAKGALAFFREKYPEEVSVYTVKDKETDEVYSRELCGGPHVERTSEIGRFSINSEKSTAQGIRRIKATVS